MSNAEIKEKFFFGSNDNMTVVWDYCILSKMEVDNSEEEVDESDEMQFEIFQRLSTFYEQNGTFAAYFKTKSWICSDTFVAEICFWKLTM